MTVLQILNPDYELFDEQLEDVIAKAPRLFDRAPIVLDCSALQEKEVDLQALCRCLHAHHLLPIAIQGANPLLETLAQCQGLAILNASSSQDKSLSENSIEQAQAPLVSKTKLLTNPVRSGQRVVSKNGDLVVTASVSQGAELLADGNIHIYGTLRGRALAGMSGDKLARIFCWALEAELIAIAGIYRLNDRKEKFPGPCQISLQNDQIQIDPLY